MHYREETTQFKSVARIYVHPLFNPTQKDNDIAVIELTTPVNYNRFVSPVCLVQKDVADYTSCVVAGWGRTNYKGAVSNILNQVVLPVVPWPDCKKSNAKTLTQNMMCAGYPEGGKDACLGDSGGPFVCKVDNRWEIHGVVSFGQHCAEPGHPGIYTRVSRYLKWINDVTDGAVSKAAAARG
jgi:secreted trypsin-like serine protease